MSFREEERQKNGCPSRGLGLAAAAIGVGVGAALYYFFSKRPENPHGEGSTTPGWHPEALEGCECTQTIECNMEVDSDDYTTISENVTSDTSINDDAENFNNSNSRATFHHTILSVGSSELDDSASEQSLTETDFDSQIDSFSYVSTEQQSETDNSIHNSNFSESSVSDDEVQEDNNTSTENNSCETGYLTLRTTMNSSTSSSDSDVTNEWDITNSSEYIPEYFRRSRSSTRRFFDNISSIISPRSRRNRRITEEEQLAILRDQAFRERPWTLEECSICFEVILRDQEVMTLPCAHNFHQACILPWLQEQQTCPNCRKRAE